MKRLWGDQFYNPKEKKWAKDSTSDGVGGFTQYILDPIYKVFEFCIKSQKKMHLHWPRRSE